MKEIRNIMIIIPISLYNVYNYNNIILFMKLKIKMKNSHKKTGVLLCITLIINI